MARYLVYILVWLGLTAEVEGFIFEREWSTWLTTVGTFMFNGLPVLHMYPWDMLLMLSLIMSQAGGAKGRSTAMTRSIKLTFGGALIGWCWGVANGGSAYQTIFQLHAFIMAIFLALAVMSTCRTVEHVRTLGYVVVFAAVYRAGVLLVFNYTVVRYLPHTLPTLTDHADSVLFVSGMFVVVINWLERRTIGLALGSVLTTSLMFLAIVLNNRRIGWLDVGMGGLMVYLLLPPGKSRTAITRTLIGLSPAIAAYISVGWGHPTGIFKPVGSISTMFGENQDTSSIMRDIENYNLIKSLKTNILFGLGWGNKYVEELVAYDISGIFPQYRYLPHNSMLGVVAFTGMIGFFYIWQIVPVSLYLHTRVIRATRHPVLRVAALSSVVGIATVLVQYWGDVGFNHLGVNVMFGVSIGLAGRLPGLAGVWAHEKPPPVQAPVRAPAAPTQLPARPQGPAISAAGYRRRQ